jgi:hypothetical protein
MAGTITNMYALSADTGAVLWKFANGGAVASGVAISAIVGVISLLLLRENRSDPAIGPAFIEPV